MTAELHEVDRLMNTVEQGGYRAVIFDLDETLARVEIPWREWNRWLVEDFPDDDLKPLFRDAYDRERYVPGMVLNQQLARVDMAEFVAQATDYEVKYYQGYTPYERLAALVPQLGRAGLDLYLWTNNTRPTAQKILASMGIAGHFQGLVTRTEVEYTKPSPDGWRHIHDENDPRPLSDYLFVGDGENDRLVAESIGIKFFYIDYFRNGPGAKSK